MIGLSGLITPSLEEMAGIADELDRRGLRAAVADRRGHDLQAAHRGQDRTALRRAGGPRPRRLARGRGRVRAARRGCAGGYLADDPRGPGAPARGPRPARRAHPAADRERARASAGRHVAPGPPEPAFIGLRQIEVPLGELAPYIDWTFFFHAWELRGRFPGILEHPEFGAAARELYEHATALLERLVHEGRLRARGAYGFWPAAADGDDIVSVRRSRAHDDAHADADATPAARLG